MHRKIFFFFFLLVATGAGTTQAATAITTFAVTATVLPSCLVSATPRTLGFDDLAAGSAIDAAKLPKVTCITGAIPYTVALNPGARTAAKVVTRKITTGGNLLNESLHPDAARTPLWSTTTVGTMPNTIPMDGVRAGQNAADGAYTDVITMTINY